MCFIFVMPLRREIALRMSWCEFADARYTADVQFDYVNASGLRHVNFRRYLMSRQWVDDEAGGDFWVEVG